MKKDDDKTKKPVPAKESGATSSDEKRRRLLKGTVATGAIITADKWTKPVVDQVILPAHAQSSPYEMDTSLDSDSGSEFAIKSTSEDHSDKT
jgi:hypothetical protein